MASSNTLFAPGAFQSTIRRMAQENGWNPQQISDEGAFFRFDMPSGRSKALVVIPFKHLFEFSVQTEQSFVSEDRIPHALSTMLLQRNCDRPLGFWCIVKLKDSHVYTYMHNVEPRILTGQYFGDITRLLLEEADRLDDLIEDWQRKSQPGVVRFGKDYCHVEKKSYTDNNRIALVLYDVDDGEQVTVATVNVHEARLAADEVVIKTYEGHEELPDALVKAGIIKLTSRTVQVGQYSCPIAKCLI
jgi:hypothetical protein